MFTYILLLHVLAATIWTGGHLVLSTTVLPRALRARDPEILLDFEGGFEKIGMPALLVQIVSGLWLAYGFLPDVGAWFGFGSFAAVMIALKLGVLALTAGLAVNARFRVVPELSPETLPLMAAHVYAVTVLSVVFVILGVGLNAGGY